MLRARAVSCRIRTAWPAVCLLAAVAFTSLEAGYAEEVPYTSSARFNIQYDVAPDQARASLWLTEDGGAHWRSVGYDPDNKSPFGFVVERDGTYGFFVVVEDLAGNRSPEPEPGSAPQLTVVVDTRPPAVEFLAPRGGAFGPSRGIDIVWRASDEYLEPGSVTIEMSRNGGTTWVEVSAGLPAEGTLAWRPQERPPEGVKAYRFRVKAVDRAGNVGVSEPHGDCLVDEIPPAVRVSGPVTHKGLEVPVRFEADDQGGSGVESIRLYVTTDDGTSWKEAASTDMPAESLRWRAPRAGSYGLFAAGTDRGGNVAPAPTPGTRPQLTVTAEAVGPTVELKSLNTGGYYRGGATQPVVWEASVPDGAVRLEYSADGGATWNEIASGLPQSGQFPWTVPKIDAARAAVRVVAVSNAGEQGSDESDCFFVIDSTPPRSVARFERVGQEEAAAVPVAEPPEVVAPRPPPRESPEPTKTQPAHVKAPPPVEFVKATEHLAAGRFAQAIALLEKLLARDPADVKVGLALGEARARETDRLGREKGLSPAEALRSYDEAASVLRAVLKVDADSNRARLWLALCLFQRASVFYKELRRAAAAVGEWRQAVTEFDKALALQPNAPDELYYAGTAFYMLAVAGPPPERAANTDRARDLLERSLADAGSGTAAGAHWYLADLAERRRDNARALEHWRTALKLFGEGSGRAQEIRGRIAALGGGQDQ